MFDRLSKYYRLVNEGAEASMSVVWKTITGHFHGRLHSILMSGTEKEFQDYIGQVIECGDCHGIEQSAFMTEADESEWFSKLSVKIGILPMRNPEQESPTENWKVKDLDDLKRRIDAELGFPIAAPPCKAYRGRIPTRLFHYAAAAYDIRLLWSGGFPRRILEIGPGLGNLAHIASKLGSECYKMIDLPTCSCMAAYFLAEMFGQDQVWLYGESSSEDHFVRVYPSTRMSDVYGMSDLVFNSDSFPEIPESSQDQYMELIKKSLPSHGLFVSINHESDNLGQRRVRSACALPLISRSPFMMRNGYIQEVYQQSLDKHTMQA